MIKGYASLNNYERKLLKRWDITELTPSEVIIGMRQISYNFISSDVRNILLKLERLNNAK
jgi:hypothetical protein